MKIITVTGYKGGIGKSTTAIHLAAYLSDSARTILVDGDPNRTALNWSKRSEKELPFDVVDERSAMKTINNYDYLVIDTPARPNSDDIKEISQGCDLIVLPTIPDIVSLQPMLETASDLGTSNYRVLLTVVPPYPSREGKIMVEELKEGGIPVFESMIRRTVGFPKAALAGIPINQLEETRLREAWTDYKNFGDEIMEILS